MTSTAIIDASRMDPNLIISNEAGAISALESSTGDTNNEHHERREVIMQKSDNNRQTALATPGSGFAKSIFPELATPENRHDSERGDPSVAPSCISQQRLNQQNMIPQQIATRNEDELSHESLAKDSHSPRQEMEKSSKSTGGDNESNEVTMKKNNENESTESATKTLRRTDLTENIPLEPTTPDIVRRDQASVPCQTPQQTLCSLNYESTTQQENIPTISRYIDESSYESAVAKDSYSSRREIEKKSTSRSNESHERTEVIMQQNNENGPMVCSHIQTLSGTDFIENIPQKLTPPQSSPDCVWRESISAQQRLIEESATQQENVSSLSSNEDESIAEAKDSYSPVREMEKTSTSTDAENEYLERNEVMMPRNDENNPTELALSKLSGTDFTNHIPLEPTTPQCRPYGDKRNQASDHSQTPQQRFNQECMTPQQISSTSSTYQDKISHESSFRNSFSPRRDLESQLTADNDEHHEREVMIHRNNENETTALATPALSGTDTTENIIPEITTPQSKHDGSEREQDSFPSETSQQSLYLFNQESMTPQQVLSLSDNETHESVAKDSLSPTRQLVTKWNSCPEMSTARYRFASAIHKNAIYIFGGGKGQSGTAEMFDVNSRVWSDLPSMKTKRNGCSCAVVGDKIYVFGGTFDSRNNTKSFEIFDTKTKLWSSRSSEMNFATNRHASISVGHKVYVFGGYRNRGRGSWYDTETNTWGKIATMHEERYSFGAVAVGNYIYAIGGMKEFRQGNNSGPQYSRYLETMEVYDIAANKWTVSKAKMKNRRSGCSVVKHGSSITVLGGDAPSKKNEINYVTAIETFHIGTEMWSGSFIPTLRTERTEMCAQISEDNELFIIGGKHGSRLTSSVESCKLQEIISKFTSYEALQSSYSIPAGNLETNIDSSLCSHSARKHFTTEKRTSKRTRSQGSNQVSSRTKRPRRAKQINKDCNTERPRRAKQIKQESNTVKKNTNKPKSFEFQSHKVAKLFEVGGSPPKIYYGTITDFDPVEQYWMIQYEDDDYEQYDRDEVLKGMELYGQAQNIGRHKLLLQITTTPCRKREKTKNAFKKIKGVKTKAKPTSKSTNLYGEKMVAKSSSTALGNKLQHLSEKLKAKLAETVVKEKEIIGVKQCGPLKDRLEQLKHVDDLVEMEKSIFGSSQKGTFEQRMKKVEDFMKIV